MPLYHRMGSVPPKRHVAHRKEGGGIHHEELIGNLGFTGPSSLLYHLRRPTAVKRVEALAPLVYEPDPERTLKLRHFRTARCAAGGSATLDRVPLLFNGDAAILFATPDRSDEHFFRNGMGDEYVYVAEGEGVLESPFGDLPFGPGDQLILHRGILHRYRLSSPSARLLIVESAGYLRWPRRYRNEFGQLLEGAPFSERDIRRPAALRTHDEVGEFELIVKQHQGLTRVVVAHHPFDLVGWDGYYYPWAFSIHDFEPITGTIHQPPPIHQFLEGDGFVLCNFCPRPFDFHPDAVPAPYNHSNVMSDEVLFYASSEFMSRKGIEYGSITLHPDGLPHGPHPGRYEASIGAERTDELAVMIDTFRPLRVARQALEVEDPDYHRSWVE